MITIDLFTKIFAAMPGEPEFEFFFRDKPDSYMLIKYDDRVTFQKCGTAEENEEMIYPSLGSLFTEELIDGISLAADWDNISEITIDSSWNMSEDRDVAYVYARYTLPNP